MTGVVVQAVLLVVQLATLVVMVVLAMWLRRQTEKLQALSRRLTEQAQEFDDMYIEPLAYKPVQVLRKEEKP